MAFCPKCGKEIAEDAKFCTACGTQIGGEAPKAEEVKTEASAADNAAEKAKELMNTPDTTDQFETADIEANKVLALLSYLGILWLVPLLAAPNSRFARYHTNQGLVLWIAELIVSVVAIIPILGWIASFVGGIITLVLAIIGIVNAVQGRAKQLPIIGKFTILK